MTAYYNRAAVIGDYVLATKYSDGDPGDHFCVGWLKAVMQYKSAQRTPYRQSGVSYIPHILPIWVLFFGTRYHGMICPLHPQYRTYLRSYTA